LKRYLFFNIIILVLVNLLIKPIFIFGIDRNVQLILGANSFGGYAALLNLSIVFNMLLDMGLTSYNTSSIANSANQSAKIKQLVYVKLILFFMYATVVGLSAFFLDYTYDEQVLLSLLIAVQGANSFLQLIRSFYSGHQHFKWDAVISVSDKLILIPIISIYLLIPSMREHFTIIKYVMWQLLAYVVVIIITGLIGKSRKLFKQQTDSVNINQLITKALPIALIIFLMAIYMRCDIFILERLHQNGKMEANLYAFCYRWLDALNMIGVLVAGMLLPLFAKHKLEHSTTNQIIYLISQFLMPLAIAGSICCFFFANEILSILGMSSSYAVKVFQSIIISFPGLCLIHIFSALLTAHERYKHLIIICTIGAVISIIGNIMATPIYGALASAWISFAVNVGLGFGYVFVAQQQIVIKDLDKQVFQFVGLIILFTITNALCNKFGNIIIAVITNTIIIFGLYYITKIQRVKQFLSA
jgi:O-antigen/teichoic acid export membrane protein